MKYKRDETQETSCAILAYLMENPDAQDTLEGIVLAHLTACQGSLAVIETYTGGQISARLAPLPAAEAVFRRGIVARDVKEIYAALGLDGAAPSKPLTTDMAECMARAARARTGATHALSVLVALDDGADRIDLGGDICLAVATQDETVSRYSRLVGGREWVRLGATEMALDCLRRYLQGLPIREQNDFEQVAKG